MGRVKLKRKDLWGSLSTGVDKLPQRSVSHRCGQTTPEVEGLLFYGHCLYCAPAGVIFAVAADLAVIVTVPPSDFWNYGGIMTDEKPLSYFYGRMTIPESTILLFLLYN